MPPPAPRPASIRITEVGPRDGLQNESGRVATSDKVAFVDLLSAAGFVEIEVSSFVSPTWVPQLGDAAEVFGSLARHGNVIYSALVPNEKGLDRAIAAGVQKIAVFVAASESFSKKNINATIAESLVRIRPVAGMAKKAGLAVRGYVSCAIACPFEGPIAPEKVRAVAVELLEMGVDDLDLGDTIGVAGPSDIERLYEGLRGLIAPEATTLHLHDTRGTALVCAVRAMELGVRSFDASCGGLGGCPFASGAAGNLATEDLVYLCQRDGIETGIDLEMLFAAGRHIEAALGKPLRGRVFSADGRGSASASCSTGTPSR